MKEAIEQFEQTIRTLDNNKTFFDTATFPWVGEVESCWRLIRSEVDNLLSCIDLLPGFEEIQLEQLELTNDKRWKIFPLYAYGQRIVENERRCPETMRALHAIPNLQAAMFSVMQGNKKLPPHCGNFAGVLRYQLGIKIPKPETQCGISVGGDIRYWEEGKSLIFDDTHMHHAWNHSNEDRVVLFVDFTRPLPEHFARTNEIIISNLGDSDFIMNAVAKWATWESVYGADLDRYLDIKSSKISKSIESL